MVRHVLSKTDAAAAGDFSKMANIAAKGDIRALQSNINTMVTKLRTAFENNINQKTPAALQSIKELKSSPVLASSSPTHETHSNSTSNLELTPAMLVSSFKDVGNSTAQV
ncbi:hypothetical protein O181_090488 [Austropuccinia psidii MF-1]|uniref:HAMP domain-containing protein n=1 Tax=Austropuccinia psidii MF-1 TaxID=1389203 RepID=A0A9Q3P6J9_9BASI|nr:hypothetical protein [Austropuccinia psidii MF-1]